MRILCCLALAFVPGLLWAAPAPSDKDDNGSGPAEQIRKDLDRPVTVKIAKQPLGVAIDILREKTKINIVLDGATIQQQLGFTPDMPPTPVDVDLKDVKARTALRAVLTTYGLGYAILGDSLLVTTEDVAAQRQMRQPVSVDLDGVDLAAAMKRLARESATNLILDARVTKEAKAEVSLHVDDVPLETAVHLLAEMAGLKALRVGNTLFVTKKETAAEMRQDPDFAQPPPQAGVYGNVQLGGLGALGGGLGAIGGAPGGPVFITPAAPNPPPGPAPVPVPPTVPPAVGPAPAPPAAGPATIPPMSGTGGAAPGGAAPAGKVGDEETKPADGGKTPPEPAPGKKEPAAGR